MESVAGPGPSDNDGRDHRSLPARGEERSLASFPHSAQVLLASECLPGAGQLWPVPGPTDDKYSGVVGIYAGSDQYPGARIMCTQAAVAATSPMVRVIGSPQITERFPEVIAHLSPQESGRVQAWVAGPGLGQDAETVEAVRWVLRQPERLVVDATALRLVAAHSELRRILVERAEHGRVTVLTPHAGEFGGLAESLNRPDMGDAATASLPDRLEAAQWLAREMGAVVLLKGRLTVVADAKQAWAVDVEHSWAATAGSGDVLAGLLGALVAAVDRYQPVVHSVMAAVAVHALAGELAARTPEGPAPVSASGIAAAIRPAVAIALREAGRF
ncbi:ADP-dependent NAD(P)H-hydrate dehydratase [Corynebacterium heidelbergense]|uniref:ADP-dependent (S)-NAD(P)H-hydrate dehydratase n=1 Tax=Corynebacterium heidelbergense TaxID=2055947 RepID=A0A364VBA6_9CORY|nr:NAD(P)H-hydrate dehydratase [Corynebacterium heidelbergense]RAV33888.1 hypothetical protein CWC39_06165 [Corynebacterium heidelbergense]WCZ37283.1 Bifunctional NAD(P)H-hydrate repair enzyme Nnr [Corynebacterium heidelbergense]